MIKLKTNIITLLSIFILQQPVAHAYKMIVFTDQADPKKALSVIEEFRSTYPFNKFEIEFQIARAKPEQLHCESSPKAQRLVTCSKSTQAINAVTQKMGGDQAIIIKDMNFHGGAAHVGFGTPVMTTGAAKNTMLHEYLHTLGLCDEYIYEKEIADDYCHLNAQPAMNKAIINPLNPYVNDADARSKHSRSIMWYSDILATTPITNSQGKYLGTSAQPAKLIAPLNSSTQETKIDSPMGLYPSGVCANATTGVKTWKPSGTDTVMNNLNAGLGKPLERIVEKMLLAKGMRLKPEFRPRNPAETLNIKNTSRSTNKSSAAPSGEFFNRGSTGAPK